MSRRLGIRVWALSAGIMLLANPDLLTVEFEFLGIDVYT